MSRDKNFTALLLTLALHAGVWLMASGYPFQQVSPQEAPKPVEKMVFLALIPPPRGEGFGLGGVGTPGS